MQGRCMAIEHTHACVLYHACMMYILFKVKF